MFTKSCIIEKITILANIKVGFTKPDPNVHSYFNPLPTEFFTSKPNAPSHFNKQKLKYQKPTTHNQSKNAK